MITILQIKAARALLSWKQEDLAQAAGLSLPSINNLERSLYSPRLETLQAIEQAFITAGIEFLPGNGVRIARDEYRVHHFEGPEFIKNYDADLLVLLAATNDKTLQTFSCDDRKWIDHSGWSNPAFVSARNAIGWSEYNLLPVGADYMTSPPETYRFLPASFFGSTTWQVCANQVAHIEFEAQRVTVITSAVIAEAQRMLYNSLWEMAKVPTAKQLAAMARWRDET